MDEEINVIKNNSEDEGQDSKGKVFWWSPYWSPTDCSTPCRT